MADYGQTRSEYLKIMLGDRKNALAPYRPEQMNDLGDTSFDVASLSDDDINTAIKNMSGTQYEGSDIFNALKSEQSARSDKVDSNKNKSWLESFGDFFFNIGTSITEGVINVVDSVKDFGLGLAGGIGGGWYGQQNDFTDWIANAMTDDRWKTYATDILTSKIVANPLEMATNIGNNEYWQNYWTWDYDTLENKYERNYEGYDWLHKGGNFVGELIPSLALAYFTGGASAGAQIAAQAGFGFARAYGSSASQALKEGATFGQASGYGALTGAVEAAFSAGSAAVGGMLASKGSQGAVKTISQNFGKAIGQRFGSTAQAVAGKSMEIILDAIGEAGEETVENLLDPAFRTIYDKEAWYNAYGTEENRKAYMAEVGKAALMAAAGAVIAGGVKEGVGILKTRSKGGDFAAEYQQEIETSENYKKLKKLSKETGKNIAGDFLVGQQKYARLEQEDADFYNQIDKLTKDGNGNPKLLDAETKAKVDEMVEAHLTKMAKKYADWTARYGDAFETAQRYLSNAQKPGVETAQYTAYEMPKTEVGDTESTVKLENDLSDIPTEAITGADGKVTTVFAPKIASAEELDAALQKVKKADNPDAYTFRLPLENDVLVDVRDWDLRELMKIAGLTGNEVKSTPSGASEYAEISKGKILVLDGETTGYVKATPTEDGSSMVYIINGEEVPAVGVKTPKQEVEGRYGADVKDSKASLIIEAAEGKEGKVFHFTDAKKMEGEIDRVVRDMVDDNSLPDEFREKYKSLLDSEDLTKEVFAQANLSKEADLDIIKNYIRSTVLDSEAEVTIDGKKQTIELRNLLTSDEIDTLNKTIDDAMDEFIANGRTSRYSKLIEKYNAKIESILGETQRIRERAKLAAEISKDFNTLANKLGLNGKPSQVKTILGDANPEDIEVIDVLREITKKTRISSKTGLSTSPYSAEQLVKFANNFTEEKFGNAFFWDTAIINELNAIKDLAYDYEITVKGEKLSKHGFHPNRELDIDVQTHISNLLKCINAKLSAENVRIYNERQEIAREGTSLYSVTRPSKRIPIVEKALDTAESFASYAANYIGKENPVYDALVTDWAKANGTKLSYQQKYTDVANKILQEEGFKPSKGLKFLNKKVTFQGEKITKGEAAAIYFSALTKKGIADGTNTLVLRNEATESNSITFKLGDGDLDTLKGFFTESEFKVLERLQKEVIGGVMKNDYVEWYKGKYHYSPDVSDDYFMLNADNSRTDLSNDRNATGMGALSNSTWGRARGRQNYKGAYRIFDFQSQFAKYGNDLAHQIGYTDYLDKARILLKTRIQVGNEKLSMDDLLGRYAPNWKGKNNSDKGMKRYFEYIATESDHFDKSGGLGALMGRIFRGGQASVLGLNPRSMAKQWLSDFTVMGDVGIGTWLKSKPRAIYNLAHYKQVRDFMINANNYVDTTNPDWAEYEPYFAIIRERLLNQGAVKGELSSDVTSKISEVTLKGMSFFDEANNVINVWAVAENLAKDYDGLRIGTKANKCQAMKYFVDLVFRTQSNNNAMYVSQLRSGYAGGLQRLLFGLFASDNQNKLQQFDSITREFYQANKRKKQYQSIIDNVNSTEAEVESARKAIAFIEKNYSKSAWGKKASGVVAGLALSGLGAALINETFDRIMAKKDKEGKPKKLEDGLDWQTIVSEAPLEMFVNWIPYVSTVSNSVMNNYDMSILPLDRLNNILDSFKSFTGALGNGDSASIGKAFTSLATIFGETFFGLPISNIYKYVKGIIRNADESSYIKVFGWMDGLKSNNVLDSYRQRVAKNDISGASEVLSIAYSMYKTGNADRETLVEIAKLSKEGLNAVAKNIPDYITNDKDEKVYLTDDQKADFGKTYVRANAQVAKLIKSSGYRLMDSASKAKSIKKIYDAYYEAARFNSMGIEPDSKLGRLLAYASDYDSDILATMLLIQQNSQLVETKRQTRKEQAVKLVNHQSMGRMQKLLTLYLMGYGVNAENKRKVQAYLVSIGFSKKQAEEFLPSN